MNDIPAVDTEQLRAHAAHLDGMQSRFEAIKAASTHIMQDESAYGLLCGWISGILEGRHMRQDELIAAVAENLSQAAGGLRRTADDYEVVDGDIAGSFGAVESWLGR